MVLRPDRRVGTAVGAAIVFVALFGAFVLGWRAWQQAVGLATFTGVLGAALLLTLGVFFAYWTVGCWTLRYLLSKNRLIIRWGGNELSIPLHDVVSVTSGSAVAPPQRARGVRWPGYHVGQATVAGLESDNPVLFFTAYMAPRDLVYVQTSGAVYALSAPDASGVVAALEERRKDAVSEGLITRTHRWILADLAFWHDRWLTALVLLALAVNLALFAYVAYWIPALPSLIQMHFTPLGIADMVSPKTDLLALPAAGLGLLLLNTLVSMVFHRREPLVAHVLTAAALVMQLALWESTRFLVS